MRDIGGATSANLFAPSHRLSADVLHRQHIAICKENNTATSLAVTVKKLVMIDSPEIDRSAENSPEEEA